VSIVSAILSIYLTTKLHYSEDTATVIYHAFSFFAFFSPGTDLINLPTVSTATMAQRICRNFSTGNLEQHNQ
jgi:hypothetical protein